MQEEVTARSLEAGDPPSPARSHQQALRRADGTSKRSWLTSSKRLSAEAISDNSDKFLKDANEKIGTLVKPLSEELKRIETDRAKSQGSLTQQIETLAQNNKALELEARNPLPPRSKRPEVRGAWGEIQLRRVVELAGMANYCDFEEQVSVPALNGGQDRPDMVVRMPNNRTIVIDAKTPMNAYLSAPPSPRQRTKGRGPL